MCVACEIIFCQSQIYALCINSTCISMYFHFSISDIFPMYSEFGYIIFILRLNKNKIPITYGIRFFFSLPSSWLYFSFLHLVNIFFFHFFFLSFYFWEIFFWNGNQASIQKEGRRKEWTVFTIHIIFSIRSLPLIRDDEFSFRFCIQSIYSCILFHSDYCGRVVMGKWADGWMDSVDCYVLFYLFFQIFV